MSNTTDQTARDIGRGLIRWWVRNVVTTALFAVTLFLPAGNWRWPWGWAMVGVYAAWILLMGLVLSPLRPELLAERADRQSGTWRWDLVLTSVIGPVELGRNIVAGFDARLGWSGSMGLTVHIVAILLGIAGAGLTVWAMLENRFFSLTVRIQEEKEHSVASDGPYRIVRHPGYLAAVVYHLAAPFVLGSWWALIPAGALALLYIVRTALEDRTLRDELAGYASFAQSTRYRLVPGIW